MFMKPGLIRILSPLAAAAVLAPTPAWAQRADVCALVACGASGQRAAVFDEPVRTRPATSSSVALPRGASSATPGGPARGEAAPWARRFQGRESDDGDVCLLNFGIGGQLARKGSIDSHVLGRTQVWREPAQGRR